MCQSICFLQHCVLSDIKQRTTATDIGDCRGL